MPKPGNFHGFFWAEPQTLIPRKFVCGYCGHWVDHIRKKGNEANHEITLMTDKDAKDLIVFLEMLLKFIYELPNLSQQEPST